MRVLQLLTGCLLPVIFLWQLHDLRSVGWVGHGTVYFWFWGLLPVGLLGLGWILWRPFNRQPKLLWPIAFTFAGIGSLTLLIAGRAEQIRQDRALAESMAQVVQGIRELRQTSATSRLDHPVERNEDRFEQHRGRISADALEQLRALDAHHQDRLADISTRYRELVDAQSLAGPELWIRARSRSELDEFRTAYVRLFEISNEFALVFEQFESRYLSDIEAADLDPQARLIAIVELERILREFDRSGILAIRRLEVEITETALEILDHLRTSWGRWKMDADDTRLHFDRAEEEWRFAMLMNDLMMLIQQQNEFRQ